MVGYFPGLFEYGVRVMDNGDECFCADGCLLNELSSLEFVLSNSRKSEIMWLMMTAICSGTYLRIPTLPKYTLIICQFLQFNWFLAFRQRHKSLTKALILLQVKTRLIVKCMYGVEEAAHYPSHEPVCLCLSQGVCGQQGVSRHTCLP